MRGGTAQSTADCAAGPRGLSAACGAAEQSCSTMPLQLVLLEFLPFLVCSSACTRQADVWQQIPLKGAGWGRAFMRADAQTRAPAVLHRLTQILCHLRNYTEPVFQVLHRSVKLLSCMHMTHASVRSSARCAATLTAGSCTIRLAVSITAAIHHSNHLHGSILCHRFVLLTAMAPWCNLL